MGNQMSEEAKSITNKVKEKLNNLKGDGETWSIGTIFYGPGEEGEDNGFRAKEHIEIDKEEFDEVTDVIVPALDQNETTTGHSKEMRKDEHNSNLTNERNTGTSNRDSFNKTSKENADNFSAGTPNSPAPSTAPVKYDTTTSYEGSSQGSPFIIIKKVNNKIIEADTIRK